MLTRLSLATLAALSIAAPAFAGAGAGGPPGGILMQIFPFIAIGVIFYFLLIRPQQTRAKKHRELVGNLKRGDTVVTQGGFIAKVTKVTDEEITVELAEGVRAKLVKGMVLDVRGKDVPAPANDKK